jgi:hypothetical protein
MTRMNQLTLLAQAAAVCFETNTELYTHSGDKTQSYRTLKRVVHVVTTAVQTDVVGVRGQWLEVALLGARDRTVARRVEGALRLGKEQARRGNQLQ